jgi:hypothetical protein
MNTVVATLILFATIFAVAGLLALHAASPERRSTGEARDANRLGETATPGSARPATLGARLPPGPKLVRARETPPSQIAPGSAGERIPACAHPVREVA